MSSSLVKLAISLFLFPFFAQITCPVLASINAQHFADIFGSFCSFMAVLECRVELLNLMRDLGRLAILGDINEFLGLDGRVNVLEPCCSFIISALIFEVNFLVS